MLAVAVAVEAVHRRAVYELVDRDVMRLLFWAVKDGWSMRCVSRPTDPY